MAETILFILFLIIPIAWIVGMIKPNLFNPVLKQRANRKWLTLIFGALFVVDVIAIGAVAPTSSNKESEIKTIASPKNIDEIKEIKQEQVKVDNNIDLKNVVSYEIVKVEDMSRKAMGNKSLSDYTTSELNRLPTNKRMSYKVVVPLTIKEAQVKPTVEKIISDLTSKDKDIDEIILDIYSDKEIINGPYDVANAIWAPYGDLGNVDAEIARDNDRSIYQTAIKIKDNLEQYLTQKSKNENLYNLTESERRQFFKDIVAAEDRAHREADVKYPTANLNNFQKNDDEYNRLSEIYREQVRKSYNLTKEQGNTIMNEGFKENWPLD